jgi:hypothetical protein
MTEVDKRLFCDRCGEIGSVLKYEDGGFAIDCSLDGRICCRTHTCQTEEQAIQYWERMQEREQA